MKSLLDGKTGNYTLSQIEAALRLPNARIGPRFEVYDLDGQRYADLSTVVAAKIDVDATRLIGSALQLSFAEPDPSLPFDTTVPFTRKIKAWLRLGMPDGGYVEWPQGVFVWPAPSRKIVSVDPYGYDEPIAQWEATCGDQTTYLSFTGPGPSGYNIQPNIAATTAIGSTLTRAMPYPVDLSGITASTQVTAGGLSWLVASNTNPSPPSGMPGAPSTSWASVLQTLQGGIGYVPPRWDWNGVYDCRPMPVYNLFSAEPDWIESTDRTSIVEVPISSVPKLDQVGNRVFAIASNSSPDSVQGFEVADADDYLPDHPYAHKNCKLYIDVTDTNGVAGDKQALKAHAVSVLFQRMAKVSELTLTTQAIPHLEPWDLLGLIVPGDPTYGTLRRLMATAWTLDLFTGRMEHKPASITGG